jgi:DNA-directed RNA polymerase specialized sigma24 family protein
MTGVVKQTVRYPDDAADVFQEVLAKIWNHPTRLAI